MGTFGYILVIGVLVIIGIADVGKRYIARQERHAKARPNWETTSGRDPIHIIPPNVIDIRAAQARPVKVEVMGEIINVRWPINY